MANSKEIKNRIKSVKSTKKITKAMELVAASKMKRAVSSTLASRLYAEYSWEVLTSIAKNGDKIKHPLFGSHDEEAKSAKGGSPDASTEAFRENVLLVFITSNRGLCGAYNAQIMKKVLALLKCQRDTLTDTDMSKCLFDIVCVGKKGDSMMRRIGKKVVASFFELPDNVSIRDIVPISELVVNEFKLGHYQRVLVAYTDFVSALSQKPNIKQIVPISKTSLRELIDEIEVLKKDKEPILKTDEQETDYLFEGDKDTFIGTLAEKLIRMQVYQMFLESNASEQSSRMVAMKNASEAAGEMIDDLTLVFNKARQSNITREISEISAGMASVN